MSIASLTDNIGSAAASVGGYDPTQQRRAQAASLADAANADNAGQAAQFAAATPPVQISGVGQLNAALASVQSTSNAVATAFAVTPTAGGNAASATPTATATPTAPTPNATASAAEIAIEIGTLNVNTGTFIPFTGEIPAGGNDLIGAAGNHNGVGYSAQVLQGVFGFQLSVTGNLGGVVGAAAPAVAVAAAKGANAPVGQAPGQLVLSQAGAAATAAAAAVDTQHAQDIQVNANAAITNNPGLVGVGARALVNVVNQAAGVAANQAPPSATNTAANPAPNAVPTLAQNLTAALTTAQGSAATGQLTFAQIGVTQGSNGQLTINQAQFQQAVTANPAGVASLAANAATQVGQVANNALVQPAQASDKATLTGFGNGDNPYITPPATPQTGPTSSAAQPSLLSYAPTAQHIYGLSQYLSVSGL